MRITLMQEMEQRVNVQLVEQHPHYYQGATISEIEDCSATAVASVASVEDAHHLSSSNASCKQETSAFTSGIVLPRTTSSSPGISSVVTSHAVQHPQAVQASPVLVLHDDQRNRLRQKALIDSVESKV